MKDGQAIIAEIGATIASTLEVGDVMATIARQVGEAFGVYSCDIHRYDPEPTSSPTSPSGTSSSIAATPPGCASRTTR